MPFSALSYIKLRDPRTLKVLLRSIFCTVVFVFCISGLPFAPGAIMLLNFNEGTGTTASDLSGNAHNGTLFNGPVWTTGKYGPGISLDGVNDYVNIDDHADYTLNSTQSYTWSAWVKNTNFNSWGTVWSQTADANNYFYFYAHSTTDEEAGPVTNGITVYWFNGTSNKLVIHSNDNVLTAGTWSYITVTYDGSLAQANRFTIYVNGVDVTNRTDLVSTGTIASVNPTDIRMGSNQPFGEYLNAAIDEVRYYSRLLSVAEIQSDMNTPIDNTAPTTSISSPANGSPVTGTINVTANASDNVGVAGVQFLLDGLNLGAEDLAAPYAVSWNTATATDGNHSLTARARDITGNIATSSAITVTVNNDLVPPTITLTSPAAGIITGTVDINANASDNIAVVGVQFLLNGVNLGAEDLTAPYSFSWNTNAAADGQYVIAARARDAAGNITTTPNLNVTVHNVPDNQPPSITLTAPAAGIINGIVNVNANANDNIGIAAVQFLLNGADLGAEDITAPYSFSWNTTTAPDGHYVLTARARDIDGNTTTTLNVNVTVYNNPDTQSPSITLTAPAAGIIAGIVNVNASADDNISVAGVQFLLNGVSLGAEDTVAPYSVSWNTGTVPDGHYTLAARARDLAGNTTTTPIMTVTVKNDAVLPVVTITAPSAGTVAGTINVNANASDNISVAGVQFLLNGSNLGAEDITAPYTVSWNTRTIANGNYTLTARARDASGNIQTSSPVVVNVLNLPPDTEFPVISITSPSPGDISGVINIAANATDNVGVIGVRFFLNGFDFGAEDLAAPYTLSWNTYSVANGNYSITAMARDAAGNVTISASVNINVNNVPDTELPTVSITSPAAGNVTGTINVTADASDNIGVAGVQFAVDGAILGPEDITTPYSVSWNTITASSGSHLLSARARDLAGNTSVVTYVNVNVPYPPVISAVNVSSITANSAVITWTTNILSNSQVSYDTTIAYKLSTLVDPALVTLHSITIQGLAPGKQYHFQAVSVDSNGLTGVTADNIFTTANLASSLGTLNGHSVLAYPVGKIIPWTPNPADGYDSVIRLAWNYLLNAVPNDPSTGKPAYYSRSYLDPVTQTVVNWPHNPAGLYSMLIESAIKYYGYSGDSNVMRVAKNVALWHLDHGMTLPNDNWPNVPYASGDAGSLNYGGAAVGNSNGQGDGVGYIQPDKIGELGHGWLQLYKYDGNVRFRDAAIQAANVLSSKIRTGTVNQSPWPYRVNAHTGEVREDYTAEVIGPISLLDGLIASGIGDTAAYRAARNIAWTWLMTYPMQNNTWAQYFEDVSVQSNYNSNLNQYNAMMTARYLLEHPEFDPNWETHVRGLITWVENNFGQAGFGSTTIKEQQAFLYPMGSHTSRYASVNALLYDKTGDLVAKEKAYRSFNWATYMANSNGVVIDGPDVNNQWFTDGYGDYIRHFMTGLGVVPEWTPFNQTHLLRSSSVVKNISYKPNSINYTTAERNAIDVLHVNFNPVSVIADGVVLQQRPDLNQPGWTLNVATKTLRIYHTNATRISIYSSTASVRSICPGNTINFSMPKPGNDYIYQWQIDSTGTGFVDLVNNAVHSGVDTDTLSLNTPPGSYYGFRYRCIASKNGVSVFGKIYILKFASSWQGNVSAAWENAANWSCNNVPDAYTDVIIQGSFQNNPVINHDTAVRSITLSPGSALTVSVGAKLDIKGK